MPLWAAEAAAEFWRLAGEEPRYPISLHQLVPQSIPLGVVSMPRLTTTKLETWLRRWEIVCELGGQDRLLRACLVCRAGRGLIFIDKNDDEAEQRYSLAHELGHYLREQWQPRQRALQTFGPEILEVLDGDRSPRLEETVRSHLAEIPIGLKVHLMERTTECDYANEQIRRAERDADLVAFELLAPSDAILSAIDNIPTTQRRSVAMRALIETYGFPLHIATSYEHLLIGDIPEHRPAFLRSLRFD